MLSRCFYLHRLRDHPKVICQIQLGEDMLHAILAAPAETELHAVTVPKYGQFPDLFQRQNRAWLAIVMPTPLVDFVLRPEEQDRRSSVDEIIVPVSKGQGEVHAARRIAG